MTVEQLRKDLDNWFMYHAPSEAQVEKYGKLRECGKLLAECIVEVCPMGPDTMAAIRKVREAVMTANASIACGE